MSDSSISSGQLNQLHSFAPGIESQFQRIFGDRSPEFLLLTDIFNFSFNNGGNEDELVPREPGVSFNPKAARIAQQLITSADERSPLTLGAAMLFVASSELKNQAPQYERFAPIVEATDAIFQCRTESAAPEAIAIAQTAALDDVRHLHLSTRNAEQRARLLDHARAMLALTSREKRYAKIPPLLTHAIFQQERRCTA